MDVGGGQRRHNPVDSICRKLQTIQRRDLEPNSLFQIPKFQSHSYDSPQSGLRRNLEAILKKRTVRSESESDGSPVTRSPCTPRTPDMLTPTGSPWDRRHSRTVTPSNATYTISSTQLDCQGLGPGEGRTWSRSCSTPAAQNRDGYFSFSSCCATYTKQGSRPVHRDPQESPSSSMFSYNLNFCSTENSNMLDCGLGCPAVVVKRLSLSDDPLFSSEGRKEAMTEVSLICEEDLLDTIFHACDTQRRGKVYVSRIVDYLRHTTSRSSEDSGLEELCNMLDPEHKDISIDLDTYHAVMREWIDDCRNQGDSTQEDVTQESVKLKDNLSARRSALMNMTSGSLEAFGGEASRGDLETSDLVYCVADLQFNNHKLQEEVRKLKQAAEAMEETNHKLLEEIEDLRMQAKIGQQSAQKEKLLKEEVEEMKASLSALEESRARVSAQSKQTERENQSLISKIASLQEENLKVAVEMDDLQKKMIELCDLNADLQVQIHSFDLVINEKDGLLQEKSQQIEDLKTAVMEYSSIMELLRAEKAKLESHMQMMQPDFGVAGLSLSVAYRLNQTNSGSLQAELALAQEIPESLDRLSSSSLCFATPLDETLDREVLLLLQGPTPEQMSLEFKNLISKLNQDFKEDGSTVLSTVEQLIDTHTHTHLEGGWHKTVQALQADLEQKRRGWMHSLQRLDQYTDSLEKELIKMASNMRRSRTEILHLSVRVQEQENQKQQLREELEQLRGPHHEGTDASSQTEEILHQECADSSSQTEEIPHQECADSSSQTEEIPHQECADSSSQTEEIPHQECADSSSQTEEIPHQECTDSSSQTEEDLLLVWPKEAVEESDAEVLGQQEGGNLQHFSQNEKELPQTEPEKEEELRILTNDEELKNLGCEEDGQQNLRKEEGVLLDLKPKEEELQAGLPQALIAPFFQSSESTEGGEEDHCGPLQEAAVPTGMEQCHQPPALSAEILFLEARVPECTGPEDCPIQSASTTIEHIAEAASPPPFQPHSQLVDALILHIPRSKIWPALPITGSFQDLTTLSEYIRAKECDWVPLTARSHLPLRGGESCGTEEEDATVSSMTDTQDLTSDQRTSDGAPLKSLPVTGENLVALEEMHLSSTGVADSSEQLTGGEEGSALPSVYGASLPTKKQGAALKGLAVEAKGDDGSPSLQQGGQNLRGLKRDSVTMRSKFKKDLELSRSMEAIEEHKTQEELTEASEKGDNPLNSEDTINDSVKEDRDSLSQNDKEIETEFHRLSLGFKCDMFTLEKRLRLEERSRDLAEDNMKREVSSCQGLLQALAPLCRDDNQCMEIIQRLGKNLDILIQSMSRVSSRSEMLGAIHQESRVSKAVEVMIQHVENLRRMYTKEHAELMELRETLMQNERSFGSHVERDDFRNKKVPGSQYYKQRHVSIATFGRSTGGNLDMTRPHDAVDTDEDRLARRSSWKVAGKNSLRPTLKRVVSSCAWAETDEPTLMKGYECETEPPVEEEKREQNTERKSSITELGNKIASLIKSSVNTDQTPSPPKDVRPPVVKSGWGLWVSVVMVVVLAGLLALLASLTLQPAVDAAPVGPGDSWVTIQQLLWPYTGLRHNGQPPV
ncbi:inositol 1,4,5-triphosphate receptor associated 2 [Scleropages formosus]|uniref:inositol 1,4,5-triphosphate receptor associated 2 n=1 Tax=Scleropages formosus TaxID=113540 RepID=UPI0010FAB823|nr:lymphoid-restricted membrane protein-like [Scleropages formosus]